LNSKKKCNIEASQSKSMKYLKDMIVNNAELPGTIFLRQTI